MDPAVDLVKVINRGAHQAGDARGSEGVIAGSLPDGGLSPRSPEGAVAHTARDNWLGAGLAPAFNGPGPHQLRQPALTQRAVHGARGLQGALPGARWDPQPQLLSSQSGSAAVTEASPIDVSGNQAALHGQKPNRMRIKQLKYAYDNYNTESKSLALKQLLKRRNVLSMQDQRASQRELQRYLNDTRKLNPYLDSGERGELAVAEAQMASKDGSALPATQVGSSQATNQGSLAGLKPRTHPHAARGLRPPEGGRKVEQGTNVDEALLREPQAKRLGSRRKQKQNLNKKPPPITDQAAALHLRFARKTHTDTEQRFHARGGIHSNMRLTDASGIQSKYMVDPSSHLSRSNFKQSNPFLMSGAKHNQQQALSNMGKISERRVNFSPQQRSHKSSQKSRLSYANLSQTAGTSKHFILQTKVGGLQPTLNSDLPGPNDLQVLIKKNRQKSSRIVTQGAILKNNNRNAMDLGRTPMTPKTAGRVPVGGQRCLGEKLVRSSEVTLSQSSLTPPLEARQQAAGELVSGEQEVDENEDADGSSGEDLEGLHASNQLARRERNFTNVNKAESPQPVNRGGGHLLDQVENISGSDTMHPSPVLCPRPIPGTCNYTPHSQGFQPAQLNQLQQMLDMPDSRRNAQWGEAMDSGPVEGEPMGRENEDGQLDPTEELHHQAELAKNVDFLTQFTDEFRGQQRSGAMSSRSNAESQEGLTLQKMLGIDQVLQGSAFENLSPEQIQGLAQGAIAEEPDGEWIDSLSKQEMLIDMRSRSVKEEKKLLKDIAEIIGQTDRQLKPYSRIRKLRYDKSKKKEFKIKVERQVAQKLYQKVDIFKEALRNKDELKHMIYSGVSFKNPRHLRIFQELEMNPDNFWELAQILKRWRNQLDMNLAAAQTTRLQLNQVRIQDEKQDPSSQSKENVWSEPYREDRPESTKMPNEEAWAEGTNIYNRIFPDISAWPVSSNAAKGAVSAKPIVTPRSTIEIATEINDGQKTATPPQVDGISGNEQALGGRHDTERSKEVVSQGCLDIDRHGRVGQATDRGMGPNARSLKVAIPSASSHQQKARRRNAAVQVDKIKDGVETCGGSSRGRNSAYALRSNQGEKQQTLSIGGREAISGEGTVRSLGGRTHAHSYRTFRASQKPLASNRSSQERGEEEGQALQLEGKEKPLLKANGQSSHDVTQGLKGSGAEYAARRRKRSHYGRSDQAIRAEVTVVKGGPQNLEKSEKPRGKEEDKKQKQELDGEEEVDFEKVAREISAQVNKLKSPRSNMAPSKSLGALRSQINFLTRHKKGVRNSYRGDDDLTIVKQISLAVRKAKVQPVVGKPQADKAKIETATVAGTSTNGSMHRISNENANEPVTSNASIQIKKKRCRDQPKARDETIHAQYKNEYGLIKDANQAGKRNFGNLGENNRQNDTLTAGKGSNDASLMAGGPQAGVTNVRNINIQDLGASGQFNVTAENGTLYENSPLPRTMNNKSIDKLQASLASNQKADRGLEKSETLQFRLAGKLKEERRNLALWKHKALTNRHWQIAEIQKGEFSELSSEGFDGPRTHSKGGRRTKRLRVLSGKISNTASSAKKRMLSATKNLTGSSSAQGLKSRNMSIPQIPKNMQNNMYLYKKNSIKNQQSASSSPNQRCALKQKYNNDLADAMDKKEKGNGDKLRKMATRKSSSKDDHHSWIESNSRLGLKMLGERITNVKPRDGKQSQLINSKKSRVSNSQTIIADPFEQSGVTGPSHLHVTGLYSPRFQHEHQESFNHNPSTQPQPLPADHLRERASLPPEDQIRPFNCEKTILELTKEHLVEGELSATLTPRQKNGEKSSKFFLSSKIMQSTEQRRNPALNDTLPNLSNSDVRENQEIPNVRPDIAVKGVQKYLNRPRNSKPKNAEVKAARASPQGQLAQAGGAAVMGGVLPGQGINSSYHTTSPDLNLTNYETMMNNSIINQNVQANPQPQNNLQLLLPAQHTRYMAIPSSNQQIVIQSLAKDEDEGFRLERPVSGGRSGQLLQHPPSAKSNQQFRQDASKKSNWVNPTLNQPNEAEFKGVSRRSRPRRGIQRGIALCTARTTMASFCSPNSLTAHGALGPDSLLTSGRKIEGSRPLRIHQQKNDSTQVETIDVLKARNMAGNVIIPEPKPADLMHVATAERRRSKPKLQEAKMGEDNPKSIDEGVSPQPKKGAILSIEAISRRLSASRGCSRDHNSRPKPRTKGFGDPHDHRTSPNPNVNMNNSNAVSVSQKTFETVLVLGAGGPNGNNGTAESGSSPSAQAGQSAVDGLRGSKIDGEPASSAQRIIYGVSGLNSDMQNILESDGHQIMVERTRGPNFSNFQRLPKGQARQTLRHWN